MAHPKPRQAVWTLLSTLLVWGPLGCTDAEPCEKRAATQSCTCSGGVPGTQVCLPELVWDECACEGGADAGDAAGRGGNGGSPSGGGAGAGGSGGSGGAGGGAAGKGGKGGAGGTTAAGDGGSEPSGDAGPDSGGSGGAGSGGAGGVGGGGGGGSGGAAADPYRECAIDDDCGAGSTCVTSSVGFPLPSDVLACAPDCTTEATCPMPAGSYEATAACVSGSCMLDCTAPDFVSPTLSCPTGFSCQDEVGGSSYCLH